MNWVHKGTEKVFKDTAKKKKRRMKRNVAPSLDRDREKWVADDRKKYKIKFWAGLILINILKKW